MGTVPLVLLAGSAVGLIASLVIPGWGDLVLVTGPSVLASLWLFWRDLPVAAPPRPVAKQKIIIDGSNVMHWKDGTPQIQTLREVVAALRKRGLEPGVIFDANAGYLLAGRYQDDAEVARKLGLDAESVVVVPKGQVADATILAAARELSAPVVSNDRFRDWADRHPEVNTPGHVIRGGYRNGALWLDLPPGS